MMSVIVAREPITPVDRSTLEEAVRAQIVSVDR
jgi:hypothetical protein